MSTDTSRLTITDLHEAERVARERPADLTDQQLALLGHYDKSFAESARIAGQQARIAAARPSAPAAPSQPTRPIVRVMPQDLYPAKALGVYQELLGELAKPSDADAHAKLDNFLYGKQDLLAPAPLMLLAWVWARCDAMNTKNAERNERIAELEAKVAALEGRPAVVNYKGVWRVDQVYGRDMAVTHGGSLWVATSASIAKRPPDSSCWQLAVRKGADGRSAKDDE